MPVLATIDLKTDHLDELVAAKQALMDPVADEIFASCGHLWQAVVRTDEGIRILNLWEDEDGRARANADPRLVRARDAVLARAGAEASYASFPVLALKSSR